MKKPSPWTEATVDGAAGKPRPMQFVRGRRLRAINAPTPVGMTRTSCRTRGRRSRVACGQGRADLSERTRPRRAGHPNRDVVLARPSVPGAGRLRSSTAPGTRTDCDLPRRGRAARARRSTSVLATSTKMAAATCALEPREILLRAGIGSLGGRILQIPSSLGKKKLSRQGRTVRRALCPPTSTVTV